MNKEVQAIEKSLTRRSRGARVRRRSEAILAVEGELRRQVSPKAWRTLIKLEEMINARHFADVSAAVRVAFRHGQRALLLEVARRIPLD